MSAARKVACYPLANVLPAVRVLISVALYAPTAALLGFLIWQRTATESSPRRSSATAASSFGKKETSGSSCIAVWKEERSPSKRRCGPMGACDRPSPAGMYHSYFDVMHLASLLSATPPKKLLFLGAGGGGLPLQFESRFPEASLDVVDLDGATLEFAREHFGLGARPSTSLHEADALEFVRNAPDEQYTFIFVDIFILKKIPAAFRTKEFFELLRRKLSHGGVVAMNVLGSSWGMSRASLKEASANLASAFGASRSFLNRVAPAS